MAAVTVRYWASMREAAGVVAEEVDATNLAEALDALRDRHARRPRFAQILSVCSLLVDERPASSSAPEDVPLNQGSVIEVLPPFAGG